RIHQPRGRRRARPGDHRRRPRTGRDRGGSLAPPAHNSLRPTAAAPIQGDRPGGGRMTRGYRRAIRIVATTRRAVAEIEDDFHHFVVTVAHDGRTVTGATGRAIRYPWSSCPLAGGALSALAGLPLSTDPIAV